MHHNYLTLVTNHETGKIVYGAEGKSAKSLDEFFDDLGEERIAKIKAATMDLALSLCQGLPREGT
ncbi:MAG: transposase [Candidatus Dormibacteria bacterium]